MRTHIVGILFLSTLAACTSSDSGNADSAADSATAGDSAAISPPAGVQTTVMDAAGRELGVLTVAEGAGGLTVTGTLRGLPPGAHGIHFHMVGSCEAPFTSAGDHWNPTGKQHGTQNPSGPHFGDLANIEVGADSSANVQTSAVGGTLRSENGLIDADGAAIVVHATADDNMTDPSGNSGARIACGRIG